MSNVEPTPRVVLVLGCHRSGTSALTRVLALLGCRLPDGLMPPQPDNPAGFWEARAVVDLHDRLLRSIGRAWDDPRPLPTEWRSSSAAHEARSTIETLLDDCLPGEGPLVLKDPRLCRLAPLWLDVLDQRGHEVAIVLASRRPLEVARSLRHRDGSTLDASGWLWLQHTLDAEHASRGRRRIVVRYDDLLADRDGACTQLAGLAGLSSPDERALSAVAGFLDIELRHHRGEPTADDCFDPALDELFTATERALLAAGDADHDQVDAVRRDVGAQPLVGVAFASTRAEIDEVRSLRAQLDAQVDAANEIKASLHQHIDDLRTDLAAARQELHEAERERSELRGALALSELEVELGRGELAARTAEAERVRLGLAEELYRVQQSRAIRIARSIRRVVGRSVSGSGLVADASPTDVAFVLVVERGPLEWQSVLFVDSLRRYGGRLSTAPVYAVSPRRDRRPRPAVCSELERLGARYVDSVENLDTSGYGTVNRIVAGAHIERTTDHDVFVVADSDTLVLGLLDALVLEPDVDMAARPVDVVGISTTGPDHEMTPYWEALCRVGGTGLATLPLTTSTVDGAAIAANYNGGLVAVRRTVGILQRLEEIYFESAAAGLRPRRDVAGFRTGAGLVSAPVAEIFGSAQAAMSVAAWSLTRRIEELPPTYNVPLHLIDEMPAPVFDQTFPGAVHVHYHWLLDADQSHDPLRSRVDSPLSSDQRSWLDARLRWRDVLGS